MYFKGMDIFKVFAAMGIVAIHTSAPVLATLGRLGVPFFALASSTLFFKKYLYLNKADQFKYLRHYLFRLFMLYLIWQIIYIPFALRDCIKFLDSHGYNIRSYILVVWRFIFPGYGYSANNKFISGLNGWGPSWYLIAMLMGLPLFCLLLKYLRPIMLGILSVAIEFLYILNSGYFFLTKFHIWGILAFPRLFIYLFIGMVISMNLDKMNIFSVKQLLLCDFIFILVFLAENIFIYVNGASLSSEEVFTTVPTSCVIFITSLRINVNLKSTTIWRNFSTFLYTSQYAFIQLINIPLMLGGLSNIIKNYIYFLVIVVCSFIVYLAYFFLKSKTNWKILSFMV